MGIHVARWFTECSTCQKYRLGQPSGSGELTDCDISGLRADGHRFHLAVAQGFTGQFLYLQCGMYDRKLLGIIRRECGDGSDSGTLPA